jgi:ABC-2 type transport system permease protein
VAVLPAIGAYVLGVCFSLDLGVIRDTWRLLPASILYGTIITVSAGTLMLALSSLSRRSIYVGIAWIGLWIISVTVTAVLTGIQRETFVRAVLREETARINQAPAGDRPHDPDRSYDPDRPPPRPRHWDRRYPSIPWQQVQQRADQAMAEAAPQNWRPLCSYTANLQRLGEALFDTDSAWVEIGRAVEAPRAILKPFLGRGGPVAAPTPNHRRLADQIVPQYPWIWSAGVLAGLWGLSVWTLSTRVRSLDRLR